jgi:acyl-CoA reductase-like NAD-dependent aldehyde dehydrogenase
MNSSQNSRHRGDYLWGSFYLQGADGTFSSREPATGVLLGEIPYRAAAITTASEDARRAFDHWGNTQLDQRISFLRRVRDLLQTRTEALAEGISREMGKALWEARLECAAAVRAIDLFVDGTRPLLAEHPHPSVRGTMRRRPVGALGVITPYPYPVFGAIQQLVPALLAGNTLVWKPSRLVPLSSQRLVEVFDSARLPPGVLSLVQGPRDPVGQALISNPGVDMLLAAGSAEMGDQLRRTTGAARPPWIQTGGKGWAIICGDADLDRAAYEVVTSAYLTSGQRCNSTARVLIDRRVASAFLKRVVALTRSLKVGPPGSPDTFCGPLASRKLKQAFDTKLKRFARAGVEFPIEGGSSELDPSLRRSGQCYVAPALALVDGEFPPKAPLPEEVQGPLLVACLVDDPEGAAVAFNDHPYGLAAAIFTASEARFRYLASVVRAGAVNWNRGTTVASARYPNAGLGKSGLGAETNVGLLYACTWPQSSLAASGPFDPSYRVPGMDWPAEMESPQQAPEGVSMTPLDEEATIIPNDDLG